MGGWDGSPPGEDSPSGLTDYGTVTVLNGSATGLTATGSKLWNQNTPGVPDAAESGDRFGEGRAS